MKALPALLIAIAALSACATLERDARLQPGVSTVDSVIALYGRPVQVWQDADGGRTLEYSSQPFGNTCFMVKLDASGKLVGVRDTLLYASRFSIEAGMSEEQVRRLLGRERTRVFFRNSGEDVWDWNVQPEQGGYLLRFNVHFKDGRVLRLSQSTVFPSDRFPDLD